MITRVRRIKGQVEALEKALKQETDCSAVLQQIGHFAKDDGDVALLFKTHPHPDDRLGKLGNAMSDRFDTVKGKTLEKRLYRIKP